MKQLLIGRNPECDLKIDDLTVSRLHAQLTFNDDGTIIIEDLNSAAGTKVNGEYVRKKKIKSTDRIELGSNGYFIDILKLIPPKTNYAEEFDLLRSVYENYASDKIRINKLVNKKGSLARSIPMAIPGLITLCVGLAISETYKPLLTISGGALSVLVPLIAVGMSSKQYSKREEMMEELNADFQVKYVCPKCKRFLGYLTWQHLKNTGGCSSCKITW